MTVTRIDYCFNVCTPFVQTYLNLLNRAFKINASNTRSNYALENGLAGSVYVKPKSEYISNTRKSYTMNFYNKLNWAENQRSKGVRISDHDIELAHGILRCEVQSSSQLIKQICNKHRIGNTFGELFDFKIAYDAISIVYKRVTGGTSSLDFYKYETAKSLIRSPRARAVIELSAEHHSITGSKYTYGRNQVKQYGIYPYIFLPKNFQLDILPNPLTLIELKLYDLGVQDAA